MDRDTEAEKLREEQIARIEGTLAAVRDHAVRFKLLVDTLQYQLNELKSGPAEPRKPRKDWSHVLKW